MASDETRVLMTGVGGLTPRSVAAGLKQFPRHSSYHIVGTDSDRYAIGLYERALVDKGYLVPRAGDPSYWEEIERIIAQEAVDVALVQPELEVEAWARRAAAGRLPCAVLLPPLQMVRTCMDKAELTAILAEEDLAPKTVRCRRDEVDRLEFELPFWIRNVRGSSGLGAYKVEDRDSLRHWVALNRTTEEFAVNAYLPGAIRSCHMLYFEGEVVRTASHTKGLYAMAKVAPSGITGVNLHGWFQLHRPDVLETSMRAVERLGAVLGEVPHGMFTVDLRDDVEGAPKITEINIRCIANVNIFAAAGGPNFGEEIIQLALGRRDRLKGEVHHRFPEPMMYFQDFIASKVVVPEAEVLGPGRTCTIG